MAAFAQPALAQTQQCSVAYDVEATLAHDLHSLEGTVTIDFGCSDATPAGIMLWLYPNRLAEPPGILDAMNTYWIYPHHFEPGAMQILAASVDGSPVDPGDIEPVPPPLGHALEGVENVLVEIPLGAPGAGTRRITIEYRVAIPDRYGLFGKARGGVLLSTGWYPLVAARGQGDWALDDPPPEATHAISLELDTTLHTTLGRDVFPAQPGKGRRTVETSAGDASSVLLAAWPEIETVVVDCDGVELRWFGIDPRPAPQDLVPGADTGLAGIPGSLPDIMALDRPAYALAAACGAIRIFAGSGGPIAPGTVVDLHEVPLRLELASSSADAVLVSDRMFDILPARKAWKFHEFQLVRAVASLLAQRALAGSGTPLSTALASDFAASTVVERYTITYHGVHEDARDILRYGAFIAAIDYFIYSPLVEFRESYFDTVAEQDWIRDEPWSFCNLAPRGKLWNDKLTDLLGSEAVGRITDRLLGGQGSLPVIAGQEAGQDLGWFWDQWSTAYPSLNYRVAEVRSEALGGGKWRHEASVERQGVTSIREPVIVRFELEGGGHEDAVWDEAGARGTVAVESGAKLRNVVVDPEMRLFEDAALTKGHPRFDNTWKPQWRPPVLAELMFTSNLTDLTGNVDVLLDLRRKWDMVDGVRLRLVAATWGQGLTLWYSHGFGPKRDLDHASWSTGVLLSGFHHAKGYGWEDPAGNWQGGTSFSAGVFLVHDDRFFIFNPVKGWHASISATYTLGVDDDGWGSAKRPRHAFSVNARTYWLWTPSGGHTLALYGGAGGTFGDPYWGQLESLSSYHLLRGFDSDETLGRLRMYLCAEWRHTFVQGLDWNVAHLVTVTGLQGVLFAGTGTVSPGYSYEGLFSKDSAFTEVGYGLRAVTAAFGAYPGILALDLAVPITPLERPGRLPIALRLSFTHTY